ncbi:MAG: glycoside hydrolase family 97 N-terminal domain-containing protein [Cyclobacteriaceae bacterium]
MSKIKMKLFIGLFMYPMFWFHCQCLAQDKAVEVTSPNGNFTVTFQVDAGTGAFYTVEFMGTEVIGSSALGFQLTNGTYIGKNVSIEKMDERSEDSRWKPVYGERNEYPDVFSEKLISLKGDNQSFDLRLRAYNEGIAFRYEFPDNPELAIKTELTEFSLPPDAMAWTSNRAQSEIAGTRVSAIKEAVERPLLVQLEESMYLALGEAALVDFARMKFVQKEGNPGTLVASLDGGTTLKTSSYTPWRFIMAAKTPGQLLENNYLLLNLNEPNQIKDVSWIKPGKVIREVTLTTQGGMATVDFAARHNLQYIEFDAGWYGNEYDDASDATTITVDPKRSKGPLDLIKVIEYAKTKNIGVILYVNRRALEKQLGEVLPLLSSWGVSGVKYGFVNVGPQEWTSWLHDAVRKASDYQLMVDIHDEYRPTGYSRTYPNLMTQEGIRGDEESPDNSMVLNTLFTRMIAGAGDHTNCYFAPRVTEKMGSHVSQLAKAVCIYSPWQFLYWYDRPKGSRPGDEGAGGSKSFIKEVPELAFFDVLPTVWDDTKVLDGHPGEYAVVARRSGTSWFVGALNGNDDRKIEVPLDFLAKGKSYEAIIYTDDANSTSETKVKIEKRRVKAGDTLDSDVKQKNGLAIHLRQL